MDPTVSMTPLPLSALTSISVALFTNSLVVTVLFPFAPLMVASFGVTDDETKIGYYAGFLATSFFIGSLVSGPLWGYLSDVIGRKTVLLIGLCSNVVFGTMFGFSGSFQEAIALRFVLGFLSTVFIAAKTAMTELCDDTNQAQGFSVFGLCWGLGLIIGPVIGGFLAEPVRQYPSVFGDSILLAQYPFLLPNLFLALLGAIGLLLCYIFLPETKGKAKPRNSLHEKAGNSSTLEDPLLEWKGNGDLHGEDDPGMWRVVFCEPDTLLTGAIFCLSGFMFVGFDELFPLWSLSEWKFGGLGFIPRNVGMVQGVAGLALIPITLVIYPWLVNTIGAVNALRCSLATGILQALIPLVRMLGPNKFVLQAVCSIIFAIRSFNETGMAALFILTGNSIRYPQYMGAVNGVLATSQAAFRALSPVTIGSLFAWSVSNHEFTFPWDYHFTWIVLGGLHVLALALTLSLPEHINRRKFTVTDR